jgi:hypothetical protein
MGLLDKIKGAMMSDAQRELGRQLKRWERLEQEYRQEGEKLSALQAEVREIKAQQRARDPTDPDGIIAAQGLGDRLKALRQAIHAQRQRRSEAQGRLNAFEQWLRKPSTRKVRGGVSFWDMRPDK